MPIRRMSDVTLRGTRVLIRETAGWAGYTYVWTGNQTDATLDPGTGTTITRRCG